SSLGAAVGVAMPRAVVGDASTAAVVGDAAGGSVSARLFRIRTPTMATTITMRMTDRIRLSRDAAPRRDPRRFGPCAISPTSQTRTAAAPAPLPMLYLCRRGLTAGV